MARPPRRTIAQRSELVYQLHEYGVLVDTREVWVAGDIDYETAFLATANLAFLDAQAEAPIVLHLLSPGGEWAYGMAIYDALRACRSKTVVLAHGYAASMSSLIPQGADVRVVAPHAEVLLHWGTDLIAGNTTGVVKTAQWLEKLQGVMADLYAERCQHGPKATREGWKFARIKRELKKKLTAEHEWYMTGHEAVDWGLFDAVLGDKGHESVEVLRGK
jgi:ATP-dependent Clp protease protease subunit